MLPLKIKQSDIADFSASIPFCFSFHLPAAGPAYEMQPPGESDSISTRLQLVSISPPENHTYGKLRIQSIKSEVIKLFPVQDPKKH